jgi:hypothetical protein
MPHLPGPVAGASRTPQEFVVVAATACVLAIALTLVLCVVWFRLTLRRRA